jgi:hypothetical protein
VSPTRTTADRFPPESGVSSRSTILVSQFRGARAGLHRLRSVSVVAGDDHADRPYDLVDELVRCFLFLEQGRHVTAAIVFTQPLEIYITSLHAGNGFSHDRMTSDAATTFDHTVADLIHTYTTDDYVELQITAQVIWGLPAPA